MFALSIEEACLIASQLPQFTVELNRRTNAGPSVAWQESARPGFSPPPPPSSPSGRTSFGGGGIMQDLPAAAPAVYDKILVVEPAAGAAVDFTIKKPWAIRSQLSCRLQAGEFEVVRGKALVWDADKSSFVCVWARSVRVLRPD